MKTYVVTKREGKKITECEVLAECEDHAKEICNEFGLTLLYQKVDFELADDALPVDV